MLMHTVWNSAPGQEVVLNVNRLLNDGNAPLSTHSTHSTIQFSENIGSVLLFKCYNLHSPNSQNPLVGEDGRWGVVAPLPRPVDLETPAYGCRVPSLLSGL